MKDRTTLARWTPRRLLSLLMALIMTLSLLPTAALAEAPDASKFSITFDAPERMVVNTEYPNAKAEVTIGSATGTFKLTAKIVGPANSCTIGYGGATITNSDTDPHDLANLGTYSVATQALHVEPISLKFAVVGEYEVTLAVVDGSTTKTSVTKTFYISDITSPTTTINAVDGEQFDVTVNTTHFGNSVSFEYGTEKKTVDVSPLPDSSGYATARFTAKNGVTEVKATLFNPDIPGFRSSVVTIPVNVTSAATPATSHTVTFLAGAADAYIPFVATATVANGDNYTIPTAEPTREGYEFKGWYDGANTYQAGDPITGVTSDIVLSAMWQQEKVTVTFPAATDLPAGVSYYGTPASTSVAKGSNVTFRLKLAEGYDPTTLHVFADGVALLGTPVNSHDVYYEYTVYNVMANTIIHVLPVTKKTFTVMMPTGHFDAKITSATPAPTATTAGSTVAAGGKSASIVYGGSYTFTVTPDPGYDVAVYVNGVKQTAGTGNSYTVAPVTGPQSVAVVESAIPNYNVTFTVPLSGQSFTQSVARGKTASRPGVAPEREGYTFEGWYAADQYPDGTPFNFGTLINENTVLFGKLTPNPYTIKYNLNGGGDATTPTSIADQLKTHGQAVKLSETVPTREGFTFLGWGTTDKATAASYQPGDMYSVDGDITLHAVWQKNTYTITLPTGQGYSINAAQSTTVTHGGSFTFTVTVAREYAQVPPVVTVTSGSGTLSTPTTVSNPDQSVSYTYTISDIKADQIVSVSVSQNLMFTVTFEAPVGMFYAEQQVEQGSIATRPADPVVKGFTFDGWYKESTCDSAWNFATDTVIGPTTIYAKLDPIYPEITWKTPTATDGYTIAVTGTKAGTTATLTNGGTVDYGSTVTFTIEILDGYDASQMQVGINNQLLAPKDKSPDGKTYTFEFTAKENTNITVVGVARKTVTIIYNDNGGYGGPVQETINYFLPSDVHNGKISKTVPTREGYDFKGWSTDNKAAWDATGNLQPGAESPFISDTVLYAVWQAKETGITLEVSNTIDDAATLKAQYEGENVTLTATVTSGTTASGTASVTTGSVQFYRSTDSGANWTLLDSKVVSGGTAIYKAETSGFKYGGTNTDTYKAVFIPTEGNGYTKITSDTKAVTVKSTAISWKLDTTPKIDADANVLTIKDKNGDPVTAMVAGQVYTLKLPAIYALDDLGTQLTVNKDYSVTWQYRDANGIWTDYTNSGSGDTTKVDAAYSQYVFRAVVTPVTGATSHFTKAAKYDTSNALVKDQYETALISEPTTAVDLQKTTTELAITGADNEENDVYINGTQPFNATAGSHLAQFEGKKVTLTATVKDTTTGTPAVTTGEVNFYRKGATADTLLNASPIAVGTNGVATYEVTISNWDTTQTAANNKDEFYAVYLANATYDTSASWTAAAAGSTATGELKAVYIKSTEIAQPVLKSKLAGKRGGADANTTAGDDLTKLLAGVQHTFSLVETGAQEKVEGVDGQFSVVAKDGRTVDAKNYTVEWLKTTGSNEQKLDVAENIKTVNVDDNKVGDKYRIKLIPQNDMKVGEVSKYAIIGKKQDVTVTVEASDEINSTAETDVYQLNKITLTAEVAAADSAATMPPKGTVTFYYSVDGGTTWTKIGDTKDLAETAGIMTASITTKELPVEETKNTKQDVEITAVYEGNETFKESATVTTTGASHTIATTTNCTTTNKIVTVYSSVVYVDSAENTTNTPGTHEIAITTEGGKVLANETNVNLKLSEVYTLDHATDAADKALLAYGTDYTVQWQMLSNAAAYPDKAADGTPWTNITSATGTTCQIDVEHGAAYRAVITVNDTPIAKGSYEKIDQGTVGTADKNDGRQVYYSNILVAANAPATLTVNVNTDNTSKGYEGIVEGETVTIHTFTSGATGTTPISQLTVNIYPGKPAEVAAATTPVAPVFTAEKADVNGHVSFDWNKDVTPGYYTLKVKATFTNGYDDKEITRTLIVRDNDYSFNVTGDNAVYNGKVQGLKVAVADMGIENTLAQKSVVVYYYTDEARTQQVEPTQAGTYYATVRLQESAYWTEKTFPATFTIKPREVSVVDLVAQAKVYDGTTNANIQEIILNDAKVDPTTGLPTDDKGIIDGDSVYAVGTGYTSQEDAGTAKLGVKGVSLKGDDAANYTLSASGYTEDFNIQRSQVKGAIVSGRTYKYTGKDIKLAASDIYLIDQAGNQLTNYEVTYYYHNGDGVEKVDAMNKMGKYTVIARPEQTNYKGGATETVYVGTTDNAGTLVTNAVSSLITISNTVELYGATTGVTATATKGTASASYYYDGAWKDTAPTAAGRYLVKVTTSTGDTAYGIYTIVKARPEFTPTTDKSSMEYTSGRYDGTVDAGLMSGSTAETYITYTGGTIQGIAYEAPTEVGKYIATVHVGETANYTAHEKQVAFEITPKALTITADDISRQQYGAYPDLTASFKGLATGGVAKDTSLRDVQIQPELIDKSNYSNDASDQVGNNYKIIAVAALARNYTVSYVDGNMSVTREDPKPYLEIRGMIKNGDNATNLAYYGDVIQLYAYGNQSKTTTGDVHNTSSILAWSVGVGDPATITQDGLLTVKGVGDVTVTLTRGIGAQQISTSLTFKAKKQEVKVVVPAEDKVYDSTTQDYTSTKTLSAVNAMGIKVFSGNDRFVIANKTRSDVGSQIVTGKVSDFIHSFQSETYGGLFTINVKDVTVKPIEATTPYGTAVTGLDYSENTPAGTDKVLTNGMAVSVADAYSNLDVLDGYEILVAGRENENYNVKYVTDQTAPDVKVTELALIIKTGTLNEQIGMTSGSLNPMGKYPVNGAAIVDPAPAMGPSNVRMYGEPNWVMDEARVTLIDGDTLADLANLGDKLVSFNYNIGADANVSYTDKSTKLTVSSSPMPDYEVLTGTSMMDFKNYDEHYTLGTQNIYQRPVTLKLREGLANLTAYKPTIIDASGNVKTDVLLDLLLNNLEVKKYNNGTLEEGGLAELLKHTIKDLKIQIDSATYDGTAQITATIKLGNTNYWTKDLHFTVTVDPTKIVPEYGPLGWTSASVTMYGVDESGARTGATYVTGDVWYMIYTKDDSVADKYSNYKDKTPVRKVKMTKGSSTGVYIANYDRLPAGEYVTFAIAEGYTIIE
mgnify:CR=1 FL=1